MALIKCLECGNEVSDKAPVCPRCGEEYLKWSSSRRTKLFKKKTRRL